MKNGLAKLAQIVPSGFTPGCSWCLLISPVSPRASVLHSLLGLSIMTILDGFSHLRPLSAARPGRPVSSVVEGWHSGEQPLHPIQCVKGDGWDHSRVNPGFGVFWFIPPSWLGLSPANLLYREDFPSLHT